MTECGQELDPFQVTLVLITLATYAGVLSASEVGGLVARQNGKGGWLEAVAIWSLFEPYLYGQLEGKKNTTLWTAHELKTSDEAYGRVKGLIEANPDLAAEVVTWNGGLTGTHIIELRDGSRLAFLARSKSSGRGFSPRRIIFDEAQQFSALAFRAMMYATSAQGARRQLIYAGTVPSPENDSAIWTGVRDRGRSGKRGRLAWAEWTPEGSDDPRTPPDPTDWKARAWANPALGDRILPSTIDEEWDAAQADLEGFMRERLSVWPSGNGAPLLFPNWPSLAVQPDKKGNLPPTPTPEALGVSADIHQTWLSLGVYGDGHLGSNLRGPFEQQQSFLEEVVRIAAKYDIPVGIDSKGPASSLIEPLRNLGVAVHTGGADEYVEACTDMTVSIATGQATHGDYTDLNNALAAAGWRYINKRRVFAALGGDISMLEAVTWARWAAIHAPKPTEPFAMWG